MIKQPNAKNNIESFFVDLQTAFQSTNVEPPCERVCLQLQKENLALKQCVEQCVSLLRESGRNQASFSDLQKSFESYNVELSDKSECLQKISEPESSVFRTEQEIVEQTEELAKFLMMWRWGLVPESPSIILRHTLSSKARASWNAACDIQELLTGTDVENAVIEVDSYTL